MFSYGINLNQDGDYLDLPSDKGNWSLCLFWYYILMQVFGNIDNINTLLIFSPSWWGMIVFNDWKPALILCILLLSFWFAISRLTFLSLSIDSGGDIDPSLQIKIDVIIFQFLIWFLFNYSCFKIYYIKILFSICNILS